MAPATPAFSRHSIDILSGRKPVSSWDDVVKEWKAAGEDKVRAELEQALKSQ